MAKKKRATEDGNGLDPRLDEKPTPKKKELKRLPDKELDRVIEFRGTIRMHGRPGQICGTLEEIARTLGVRFYQDLRLEGKDIRGGETYFAEVSKGGQMNAAGVVRSE